MVPATALSGVAGAVPLTDRERGGFGLVRRGLRAAAADASERQ